MNVKQIDRAKFERDGFLLVKDVLTDAEVALLRQKAYDVIAEDEQKGSMFMHNNAKNHLGCLTNIPEFKDLVLHQNIVKIAETLLGNRPTFFGDGIFEIGKGNRGYHKDTSERKTQNHPDWQEDFYPIVRIALYLQDHKDHSGGLKVRVASNRTVKTHVGRAYIIPSEARDAVAFSLRTTHAGNSVRLKPVPNMPIHPIFEKRTPEFIKRPEEKERVSFFLTYGLKSGALDRFMNFMFQHHVYKQRIERSEYPDWLVDEITTKVDFLNIKSRYAEAQAEAAS